MRRIDNEYWPIRVAVSKYRIPQRECRSYTAFSLYPGARGDGNSGDEACPLHVVVLKLI